MSLGFKNLEVWKMSMKLANAVYDITEQFPNDQRYGLTQQIQRSAVSVPSNISEGSARANKKEFIQFLYIARGSLAELETQLILAYARQFMPKDSYKSLLDLIESINKMLGKLIKSIKNPKPMTIDS